MQRPCRSVLPSLLIALIGLVGCNGAGSEGGDAGPETAGAYPSEPARIVVDAEGDDWTSVPTRHADPSGDGGALDLGRLWMGHDSKHLFLRMDVGGEITLSEGNELTMYLDVDNDASTGRSARGLGADVVWTFGERSGTVYEEGTSTAIGHADLGLTALPTVTSAVFEVALRRSVGGDRLLEGDSVRVALAGGGDQLPDGEGGVGYAVSAADLPPLSEASLGRPAEGLRLLTANVERGNLFAESAQPSYERIFRMAAPGVFGFSEVYNRSAETTAETVQDLTAYDGTWHHAKLGLDLVAVSRYPIQETHAIPGYEDNQAGAFLLDTAERLGTKTLLVLAHPPCCNDADAQPSRDARRQRVVDGIVAFLRKTQNGEGPFTVAPETPIVVAGDMNFVGDAQQPTTLRTGDIINNDRFGPDAAPDWDDSPLLDTSPRQTGAPLHTTWINEGSSFPPGRLDYVYVSDSVLEVTNEYVLRTDMLSPSRRAEHGLEAGDRETASDHLPMVVDLTLR
jgi:endonuclease/exonuclease/phosphatase (EEP) superfamily protein YafD